MIAAEEITVGGFNVYERLDESTPAAQRSAAIRAIEELSQDVTILCLPELTSKNLSSSYKIRIQDEMRELGFTNSVITQGVRADGLHMALLSRIGTETGTLPIAGAGELPYIDVPGFARVIGVHNPSNDVHIRHVVSRAIVTAARSNDTVGGMIAVGDFNAARVTRDSSTFTRALHVANSVVQFGPQLLGIEGEDYYKGSSMRRAAGKIIRACSIADGTTMDILTREGFEGSPIDFEPTVYLGKLALSIDHIFATPDYRITQAECSRQLFDAEGMMISDHVFIKAHVIKV